MEPTSVQKVGGRGSLESPEVYENVPGHILPIIEREFDDFDREADRFLDGQIEEEKFIGFRLKQGVYGQRQPDVQMIRIKLPFGGVSPDQLEAVADVVERFTPLRKGHVTTRQCIQLHHIPLPDAAKAIRILGQAGLSSREACGNTVRNVTGDPWAGVAKDEVFDITPYAAAYARYFVRHEVCQLMPRKLKTAFTGSDSDRAVTPIHDLGFVARIREIDGKPVRGFEIRVGGGTSIMPRLAVTVTEFARADDGEYLKIAEAIMRIFDRQDWLRVNRSRARIKVLIDKIGVEAFREMVAEELKGDWVDERDFDPTEKLFLHDEEANAPLPPANYGSPNGDRSEFERFKAANVREQRQEGFYTVEVKITRGDLTPEQFRGLAAIIREYAGGYARATADQNILIRWVPEASIYDVYRRLGELGLNDAGAQEINDVVSCPGTDSCKLGITSSMGLNRAVQKRVEEMNITDPLTRKVHIRMSGCPNGCSRHHIGTIGFYGASLKIGEYTVPAYVAHIGGRYDDGKVNFGTRLKIRLPSKRVPDAVERWLRFYERERHEGEEFADFAERVGPAAFEDEVDGLSLPMEFNLENLEHFVDWSRNEPYKVVRGEGECAV
jgi:sulfite reductase beta subunit-like hemoprotein